MRVRQPLRSVTIAGPTAKRLVPYRDLIRSEVNVKEVQLADRIEDWATLRLQVKASIVGPRLGAAMKKVLAAVREGEWTENPDGGIEVAGHRLAEGEYELRLQPKEGVACGPLPRNEAIVALDLTLSEELIQEGIARDVVRAVQQARKEAGLHVSDRIRLALAVPDGWRRAAQQFRGWIAEQTLAHEIELVDEVSEKWLSRHEAQMGGQTLRIGLVKLQGEGER